MTAVETERGRGAAPSTSATRGRSWRRCSAACALHDLHEGIDNHCSAVIPGRPGRFLLNPYGPHWSELRGSDLLEVAADGSVVGDGEAETTAFALHAAIHAGPSRRQLRGAHPHALRDGARRSPRTASTPGLSQNAAKFHGGRYAYHREYGARFLTPEECAPIAASVADGVRVVLLRNHGVLVVGETVARAWWDLYFFERAAMVQVLAGRSGGTLAPMDDGTARAPPSSSRRSATEAPLTWAAVRRRLDGELPGYAD